MFTNSMRQWLCQHRYTGLKVMVSQQNKSTGSAEIKLLRSLAGCILYEYAYDEELDDKNLIQQMLWRLLRGQRIN